MGNEIIHFHYYERKLIEKNKRFYWVTPDSSCPVSVKIEHLSTQDTEQKIVQPKHIRAEITNDCIRMFHNFGIDSLPRQFSGYMRYTIYYGAQLVIEMKVRHYVRERK